MEIQISRVNSSMIVSRGDSRTGSARRAFTLLELVVVLTVIALVAAISLPRLAGTQRLIEQRRATQILARIDSQARILVQNDASRRVSVHFDIDRGTIQLELDDEPWSREVSLPKSWAIEEFWSRLEHRSSGEAVVVYTRPGVCQSYSIRQGEADWTIVAGLSGQRVMLDAPELEEVASAFEF